MMQIDCPFCGRRDETEFSYGGEAHISRPALDVDDARWTEYLFFRNNMKGVHAERWRHARGCGQWFNAVRNTATHQFLAFYRTTNPRPAIAQEPNLDTAAASADTKIGVVVEAAIRAPAESKSATPATSANDLANPAHSLAATGSC